MNTAVFSVVSAVLIKPLPYPDAERIVWLANYNQRYHFEASTSPDFTDWRTNAKSFEEMAGYLPVDKTMLDGGQSSKHPFVSITPAFWRMTGSRAAVGRCLRMANGMWSSCRGACSSNGTEAIRG
jgi:hypothetical protein